VDIPPPKNCRPFACGDPCRSRQPERHLSRIRTRWRNHGQGGGGSSTYLWNTRIGKITATLTAHNDCFGSSNCNRTLIAFTPGGKTLATSNAHSSDGIGDGSASLWDTATGRVTATLTDPGGYYILSLAFAPGGVTLAAAGNDNHIYLWDTTTGTISATLTSPGGAGSVAFSPDGKSLAASRSNGSVYIWDTTTRKITATLTDPRGVSVESVAFSPDGETLATGDINGNTYL
jgi:WD40 repeat protein